MGDHVDRFLCRPPGTTCRIVADHARAAMATATAACVLARCRTDAGHRRVQLGER